MQWRVNDTAARQHPPPPGGAALQECPTSGLVWAEAIELEPPASKKAKSKEALKRNDKDPRVVAAVAKCVPRRPQWLAECCCGKYFFLSSMWWQRCVR